MRLALGRSGARTPPSRGRGWGCCASVLPELACHLAELRPRVGELIGAPGFPHAVMRMGYPEGESRRTPRRPVETVFEGT